MPGPSCSATSPCFMATRSCVAASLLLMAKTFQTSPEAFIKSPDGGTVFMVPLDTQHVPVVSAGRQVAVKTAYYGDIFVGAPHSQNFTVVFDTGSGHLILPSAECTEEACTLHQRYDYSVSNTSTQLTHDGETAQAGLVPDDRDRVNIAYGTGEITGDFVRETVCVGMPPAAAGAAQKKAVLETPEYQDASISYQEMAPANCASVRVVSALEMTEDPFSFFSFDGVLGLGLVSLALDPEYHFFGQLAKRMQIAPVFSFFLSRNDDVRSEIAFGGNDPKRMDGGTEAVRFVPVERPQDGHWRVKIHGVRVGDTSLPHCDDGGCSAIIDTGTSTIGIPKEFTDELFDLTVRKISDHMARPDAITQVPESEWPDCRQVPGPPMVFDLGDLEIVLHAEDYSRPVPMDLVDWNEDGSTVTHTVCKATLLPLNMPALGERVFIFGKPFLQKYYTTFDLKGERIGFVPALHPSSEKESTSKATTAHAATEASFEII